LQKEVIPRDLQVFLREILCSIRELNRRISELKLVIRSGWCNEESKKKVIDRIMALNNTKYCFIYSIQDMRCKIINSCPLGSPERAEMGKILNAENLYEDLKNL